MKATKEPQKHHPRFGNATGKSERLIAIWLTALAALCALGALTLVWLMTHP